jgi:hypothetical protein
VTSKRAPTAKDVAKRNIKAVRDNFRQLLPHAARVWVVERPIGHVRVISGSVEVLEFQWSELRRELSPKHLALVKRLIQLLVKEAAVAEVGELLGTYELDKTDRVTGNLPRGGKVANRIASALESLGPDATVTNVAAKAKAAKSYVSQIMSGKK